MLFLWVDLWETNYSASKPGTVTGSRSFLTGICEQLVNMMKKSLTNRIGQNREVYPYFLRRKDGTV